MVEQERRVRMVLDGKVHAEPFFDQHSLPALAKLHAWLTKTLPAVTPKSALGSALSYMRDY